jgi:DNA-binding winged helix-turn-helix (wHTH) protein
MIGQIKRLFDFGSWCLDATDRVLLCNATGQPVPLTPKALDTLVMLVENHGRLVTKDELMRTLWPDTFVEEAGLARNISALRKALGGEGEEYIQTLPKRGYRFAAVVRERQATPSEGKLVALPPDSAGEDVPRGHSLYDSTAHSSIPAIEGSRLFAGESGAIKPEPRGPRLTLWIAGVAVTALLAA